MNINTDINILGGIPDLELINSHFRGITKSERSYPNHSSFTKIKTDKSVRRFERAIKRTLLTYENDLVKWLVSNMMENEGISDDSLLMLFWNASFNNQLFNYLNIRIYFPAYYSGRLVIKKDEVFACLSELKSKSETLTQWSAKTIDKVASKYLTLLRKLKLLEGSIIKKIRHPYLSDLAFIHFFYWIMAVESRSNILENPWLPYSFYEKYVMIERLLQKKYSKWIDLTYTGDKLIIEPLVDYKALYNAITKP